MIDHNVAINELICPASPILYAMRAKWQWDLSRFPLSSSSESASVVMAGCTSCRAKNNLPNLGLSNALRAGGATIPCPGFGQCLGQWKNENDKMSTVGRLVGWTV